jgi:uncharacterized protein DUF2804
VLDFVRITTKIEQITVMMARVEPYRGTFGDPRPARLHGLRLPPAPMPGRHGRRPLKAWRYVAIFSPELIVCAAAVRIGPARQAFWAVWDRADRRLHERTVTGRGAVRLTPGRLTVSEPGLELDVTLDEQRGIEAVCPSGDAYGWTRKQGGIPARGRLRLGGRARTLDGRAIVDDTAAYYVRHTHWRWAAGVGEDVHGRAVAWNLVDGVNDPTENSERTIWVDGAPREAPPQPFAADLSSVGELRFHAEAQRRRHEHRILVRSRYRQPFGTVSGILPGGVTLASGLGVMEDHDVWW